MKTRFLLFAATLCCIFLTQKMDAQVTSVNYRLKYNPDSCRYEAYVVINSGTATTAAQRTQFNSQFTIVVPQADSIVLDSITSYAPYQNNSVAGSGTTPMEWNITTKLRAPGASPSNRFYSITPNLSPASRYGTALKPTLQPGDEILLFTFKVSSISTCGSGIRIWENGSDPQSDQSGMQNSDFSNGFTLGGISQLYNANSTQLHPPAPVLLTVTSTCAAGIEIDLTDSTRTCQLPLTYSWAGPGGYTTNTQDVSRPTATVADQGTYTVTVTDFYGCTATTSVVTSSKPRCRCRYNHMCWHNDNNKRNRTYHGYMGCSDRKPYRGYLISYWRRSGYRNIYECCRRSIQIYLFYYFMFRYYGSHRQQKSL
jgi:hypothetical protein